jgi:hypothetical protein
MNEDIKNREDAENSVKEDVMKSISSGEEMGLKDLKERVDKKLESKTESVKKVIIDSSLSRGSIIETSIHLENILNEIINTYYDPLDQDIFRKDFLFKTLGFSQKKDIINSIIKRENLKEKNLVSKEFGKKFNDLIEIRNIYAHYPEDVFNESSYIETSHQIFKSMKELNQTFFELARSLQEDLTKITIYVAENFMKNNS